MKRTITRLLTVLLALAALSACESEPGANADLVFVNDSGAVIVEVVVDFVDQGGGTRHADSSPMNQGETFGFEAGQYPLMVTVYDAPFESPAQKELASLTIQDAPSEGERWYVTARDGKGGLKLDVSETMPEN